MGLLLLSCLEKAWPLGTHLIVTGSCGVTPIDFPHECQSSSVAAVATLHQCFNSIRYGANKCCLGIHNGFFARHCRIITTCMMNMKHELFQENSSVASEWNSELIVWSPSENSIAKFGNAERELTTGIDYNEDDSGCKR